MCLFKMLASNPRSDYLGHSFHHRGCSVPWWSTRQIYFICFPMCCYYILIIKNICMFASWCPLQTFDNMVQVYTSLSPPVTYLHHPYTPAPPFQMPPPRPPQKPEHKQRPPTNRARPLRQPLIEVRVPGRRSHWNDNQKDVIEAGENGGYQEAGYRIWY